MGWKRKGVPGQPQRELIIWSWNETSMESGNSRTWDVSKALNCLCGQQGPLVTLGNSNVLSKRGGRSHGAEGRALPRHMADPGLIPDTPQWGLLAMEPPFCLALHLSSCRCGPADSGRCRPCWWEEAACVVSDGSSQRWRLGSWNWWTNKLVV